MRAAKTLIRLGECPGWSESSLGAHAILLVLSWGGSFREDIHAHKAVVLIHPSVICLIDFVHELHMKFSYSRNFKTLASICGCAGRFVSGLVGNARRHVLSCRAHMFSHSFNKSNMILCTHITDTYPYLLKYRNTSRTGHFSAAKNNHFLRKHFWHFSLIWVCKIWASVHWQSKWFKNAYHLCFFFS